MRMLLNYCNFSKWDQKKDCIFNAWQSEFSLRSWAVYDFMTFPSTATSFMTTTTSDVMITSKASVILFLSTPFSVIRQILR